MSILLVLIPISLLLLGIAIAAFVWAVKRGQYDDLDTPALDILTDDARPAPPRDAPSSARALAASGRDAETGCDVDADVDADEDGDDISHADGIDAEGIGTDSIRTDSIRTDSIRIDRIGTDREHADGADRRTAAPPARSRD